MKPVKIVALGGCHVSGYPIGPTHAFPTQLCALLDGEVLAQVANLQFVRLPDHLATIGALQPSHVVLQIGNYEFSASLRSLLQQYKRALGIQSSKKKSVQSASLSSIESAAPATPESSYFFRVVGLGLITIVLWLFSARHRRTFRALNACMRENSETAFVFLSPFPCLSPAHSTLRKLGGWLLRRGLAAQPNCHWIDSLEVLSSDRKLFVDQLHLNKKAHRALAYRLAACFISNSDHS